MTTHSDNYASQVIGRLKEDILTGYFQPGEKLRMSRLKEYYQVGVSPLREALSRLMVEQLVEVENQRGFRVCPISRAEMLDIYETRAHIESLCVTQAMDKGDDKWEAGIVAAAHYLKKAGDLADKNPQEIQQWEKRHHAFHSAIASGCLSPSLLQVRRSLYERASRYRNLWLNSDMSEPVGFFANNKEHDELVEAVLGGDKTRAGELVFHHIQGPSRTLLPIFA
ncbi:MAG: GntR family transcriptional regulator [Gammaproteobacteria bacterium]|nr:MAG: GntR family transcriptional regulator [Gammaproteobacteria bacterium]